VTVEEPTTEPGAPTVQAFADPTSGTAPLEVCRSAVGLDPDGGALAYRWRFSDGGSALGQSLERTYTTPGTYTATVEVTDDEGDKATDTVTITVTAPANAAPVIREAEATPTSGDAPLEVWFHAVADDPEGKPLTYKWEFGDGSGSALGDEAEHTYLTKGTYTAKLTVTDQGGETATKEFTITVADPPGNRAPVVEAAAVPAAGQAPLAVLLTANGIDPDGDALTYAWDFGDGTTGKGRRARHTYTQVGTFEATVTASDGKGGTATATVEIVVGNPPANQAPTVEIAADPAGGTAPLKVNFSAAGLDPDGDALSYVWSFGDGGAAGGPKVSHTFTQAGSYTVTVTVKDAHGNTGTKSLTLVVAAPSAAPPAPPVQGAGDPVAPPRDGAKSILQAVKPASIAAFGKRGVKVTLRCATAGRAKLSVRVSKRVARRLGVHRRAVASGTVRCVAGKAVSYRVKPTRKVRKALKAERLKSLRLTLRLALPGSDAVQRKLTVRR
jgi:PKD repeat protein